MRNHFSVPRLVGQRQLPSVASLALLGLSLTSLPTAAQKTAFPLGMYVGVPNGNDAGAERWVEGRFDQFVTAMKGARPTHFNTFTDFTHEPYYIYEDPNTHDRKPQGWKESAGWAAWSCNMSGDKYFAASTGIIPVIGVPMNINGQDSPSQVNAFYLDVIAGKYDDAYKGIVYAWADQQFKTIKLRNGWEFNGDFMPWSPGHIHDDGGGATDQAKANFIKAFQRIATIEHQAGKDKGITVKVVWNPNGMTWCRFDPRDVYPGNDYVDIISVDMYSPLYPRDLSDWAHTSKGNYPRQLASPEAFAAEPANRRHFWDFPGGKADYPEPAMGDWSWSVRMTIDFAKSKGKPIALDETGAGPKPGSVTTTDDGEFPHWLSDVLKQAQSQGVAVDYVNIWTTTERDGDWNFLSDSEVKKPQEAAAWATYFGAGSGSGSSSAPAPTTDIVSGGVYQLLARHSGKALDVENGSTADGGKVQQWKADVANPNQHWRVDAQPDGTYTLTHNNTNGLLDVQGNSNQDGAAVQQYHRVDGNPAQRWQITPASDGYYKLVHQGANGADKALDVPAYSMADGAELIQYAVKSSNDYNQQWQLVRLDDKVATTAKAASASLVTASSAAPLASAATAPLSVYPNPSHGAATLSFAAQQAQHVTVYVHTAQGQLVSLLTVPVAAGQTNFPLPSTLTPGTYFVRATLDGQKQKFTLQVQ